MLEVVLQTSDGSYVTTGVLPPFIKLPKVLIWGDRCFQLDGPEETERWNVPPSYKEAFMFVVLQTKQQEPVQ